MSASRIRAWGNGLSNGYAGQQSTFFLKPNGLRMSEITFAVEGPFAPKFTYERAQGGVFEITYVPTFPGIYKIHIKFFGRDIPGSPFKVEVIGDAQSQMAMVRDVIQNVKILGPAAKNGKSLITNQFLLDARKASVLGGLYAFMEGPGNIEIGFKENLDGTYHVQYKPSNSGVYKLNIKFGGVPVTGSPFIINVI